MTLTLPEWISAWADGSAWKNTCLFLAPTANYVEIEHYYVKTLLGWGQTNITYNAVIGQAEYEAACRQLEKFDIIMVMCFCRRNFVP